MLLVAVVFINLPLDRSYCVVALPSLQQQQQLSKSQYQHQHQHQQRYHHENRSVPSAAAPFAAPLSPTAAPTMSPSGIDLGTTIVAIKYRDGVVVGADTRTSVSSTYVSNRYANKIVHITDQCVICRSGSAADTQKITKAVQDITNERYCKYHGIHLSISQVAYWLRYCIVHGTNNLKSIRENNSISLVIAGYDRDTQSSKIYSIASSGALFEEDLFAVSGSGSTYIIAHLDYECNKRQKQQQKQQQQRIVSSSSSSSSSSSIFLEEGDAIKLCQQVIQMAIHRDGSSGGVIRLNIINRHGIRTINVLPPSSSSSSSTATASMTKSTTATMKNSKNLPGFADAT